MVRTDDCILDDQVIQTYIAMDWPDDNFLANAAVSQRKSLDETTVFLEFED